MKLFFHYCTYGFSNCYILGPDTGNKAVIIDPGTMDEPMLEFIENNNYIPGAVLVTHSHPNHIHGLRTLRRIYDPEIYAVNHMIQKSRATIIKDGDTLKIGSFSIAVISVPGHSSDSAVFRLNHFLFTGDALSAGLVGSTASAYGKTIQTTALRSKILSLPGDYQIFPGHGPPSTMEVERQYNAGLGFFDLQRSHRPGFRIGF
ncbi:MAG: MBL fold metallo-hydrolase [Treponema sp.]|jgi:glyoxylase-like metal-dependent hydrolase (beta-lactamase superfamily II)|nr:MBL fold metallo-hydrolase [Treponema sp.]